MSKQYVKQCPECSSKDVIPIMYGMPDPEMQKKYDEGKIKLGGCSIDLDNMPDRYCNECEHKWFKDTKYCTRCKDVVMYCDCYKGYIEDLYDGK